LTKTLPEQVLRSFAEKTLILPTTTETVIATQALIILVHIAPVVMLDAPLAMAPPRTNAMIAQLYQTFIMMGITVIIATLIALLALEPPPVNVTLVSQATITLPGPQVVTSDASGPSLSLVPLVSLPARQLYSIILTELACQLAQLLCTKSRCLEWSESA